MLEQFVIVTAYQDEKGKKSPLHMLEAQGMEVLKCEVDVIKKVIDISISPYYKNVVVKNIYSVNEHGAVQFYDVIFNGKLFLKEIGRPQYTYENYTEDDLPFSSLDNCEEDDFTNEIQKELDEKPKGVKRKSRKLKDTCSTCNKSYKDCTCHPGLGDDD